MVLVVASQYQSWKARLHPAEVPRQKGLTPPAPLRLKILKKLAVAAVTRKQTMRSTVTGILGPKRSKAMSLSAFASVRMLLAKKLPELKENGW